MAAPRAQSTATPFTASPNFTADSGTPSTPAPTPSASRSVATTKAEAKQYFASVSSSASGCRSLSVARSAPQCASPAASRSATVAVPAASAPKKNEAAWWKFSVATNVPRSGGRNAPRGPHREYAHAAPTPRSRASDSRHAVKFPPPRNDRDRDRSSDEKEKTAASFGAHGSASTA